MKSSCALATMAFVGCEGADAGGQVSRTEFARENLPRTVMREIVSGSVFAFEQELRLGPIVTPLRSVAVILENRPAVWLHNPLQPTTELREWIASLLLTRKTLYIVSGTYAVEHVRYVYEWAAWAEAFDNRGIQVEVWTVNDTWPIDRPIYRALYGIASGTKTGTISGTISSPSPPSQSQDTETDVPPAWADEIEFKVLELKSATPSISGDITEAAFFHRASGSLFVSDLLVHVSGALPSAVDDMTLLNIAREDTRDPLPPPSERQLYVGWLKMVMLTLFFTPEHEEIGFIPPHAYWSDGVEKNFDEIKHLTLFVPPVLRMLVYELAPGAGGSTADETRLVRLRKLREFASEVLKSWELTRIVPSHFDIFEAGGDTNYHFARAFDFVDAATIEQGDLRKSAMEAFNFNEADLRTLRLLQRIVR